VEVETACTCGGCVCCRYVWGTHLFLYLCMCLLLFLYLSLCCWVRIRTDSMRTSNFLGGAIVTRRVARFSRFRFPYAESLGLVGLGFRVI